MTDRGNSPRSGSSRLDDVLASLPRERASEDFTTAVLDRVADARRPAHHRGALLALAASFLLALGLGAHEWQERREGRAAAERIAAMEIEARLLQAEIDELRAQAREAYPVVYVGGNDDIDVVVDLARLVGGRPASELIREQNAAMRLAYTPPADAGQTY
ncbi:MAG: hypothetical protein AAGE94_14405 [Acidobacteriota bacterium]